LYFLCLWSEFKKNVLISLPEGNDLQKRERDLKKVSFLSSVNQNLNGAEAFSVVIQ